MNANGGIMPEHGSPMQQSLHISHKIVAEARAKRPKYRHLPKKTGSQKPALKDRPPKTENDSASHPRRPTQEAVHLCSGAMH